MWEKRKKRFQMEEYITVAKDQAYPTTLINACFDKPNK